MYDISPLIWHLRKYHAKFVSKIELTRQPIPSIPFNLIHGGGANIDRKDPKQSISEILKLAGRMRQNNWSAVIFPEGTRTRNGKMKPFAAGGVATLLKKVPNAIVVPIAIKGSWELTQYGTYPLKFGQGITYKVLGMIEQTDKSHEQIVEEAEQTIRNEVEG
jgi:1-acyl-sn-glycerol-3-phosphate acyltransferase